MTVHCFSSLMKVFLTSFYHFHKLIAGKRLVCINDIIISDMVCITDMIYKNDILPMSQIPNFY